MPRPYLPHAIYSMAIISLSVHLVNTRKKADEERARVSAQISILESVSEQLRSNKPLSEEELSRLRQLAKPPELKPEDGATGERVTWSQIFRRSKEQGEPEMSKWEKQDMEKLQKNLEK